MPQMRHHASVYLKSQRTISLLLRRMRLQRHSDRLLQGQPSHVPLQKRRFSSNTGTYRPQDSRNAENSVNEVPMLPGDYKALAPTVMQKIKPLDESPDCTDSDQLAARRYLADQGISSPPPLRHTSAVCAITASPKTVRTSANRLPASFPASHT